MNDEPAFERRGVVHYHVQASIVRARTFTRIVSFTSPCLVNTLVEGNLDLSRLDISLLSVPQLTPRLG